MVGGTLPQTSEFSSVLVPNSFMKNYLLLLFIICLLNQPSMSVKPVVSDERSLVRQVSQDLSAKLASLGRVAPLRQGDSGLKSSVTIQIFIL